MTILNHKQFREDEGEPWYHSSKANLTPGVDQVLPSNDDRVGRSNYGYSKHDTWSGGWDGDENRGDFTFAADTEEEAEAWTPAQSGRPVTYVVRPPGGPVEPWEIEDHHTMVRGVHAKVEGPMDIVDRIDIPRPGRENTSVQGTLPPQDWNRFRGRDLNDETFARQRSERHAGIWDTGNDVAIEHDTARRHREQAETMAVSDAIYKRHDEEQAWRKAGQQSLFRDPYGYEGPEDWERPR